MTEQTRLHELTALEQAAAVRKGEAAHWISYAITSPAWSGTTDVSAPF